ncbi:MAG: hypothetical protein NTX85_02560 [Candidatus Nomurabacteria bacterium]|nr:hypothetical protein [Candidatus Nomurabacteria bacterium]
MPVYYNLFMKNHPETTVGHIHLTVLHKAALLMTGEYEATMVGENFAEIKRTH